MYIHMAPLVSKSKVEKTYRSVKINRNIKMFDFTMKSHLCSFDFSDHISKYNDIIFPINYLYLETVLYP